MKVCLRSLCGSNRHVSVSLGARLSTTGSIRRTARPLHASAASTIIPRPHNYIPSFRLTLYGQIRQNSPGKSRVFKLEKFQGLYYSYQVFRVGCGTYM